MKTLAVVIAALMVASAFAHQPDVEIVKNPVRGSSFNIPHKHIHVSNTMIEARVYEVIDGEQKPGFVMYYSRELCAAESGLYYFYSAQASAKIGSEMFDKWGNTNGDVLVGWLCDWAEK